MAEMGKAIATRSFQSAYCGSRDKGERFDYPLKSDPAGIIRDGSAEREVTETEKPAKGDKTA